MSVSKTTLKHNLEILHANLSHLGPGVAQEIERVIREDTWDAAIRAQCKYCEGKEAAFLSVDYEPRRNSKGVWFHEPTQPLAENRYCEAGKLHEARWKEGGT